MINKVIKVFIPVLLFSVTAPAQPTNKINRDSFYLEYPANWKVDTADEDYDADALFSIDAPDDNGMVMFIIIDLAVDLDEMLNGQENEIKGQLMKKPTGISTFNNWGNFTGKGRTYKGKILGLLKGEVKIFACHAGDKTLFVMEQLFDETIEETKKQLSAISSSFRFK